MARTKISEYSATAADNTDINSINIAEGCAPSGINNAIREMMKQLKDFQAGTSGDSFTNSNVVLTGGSINGTTIGASSASTGAFTNLSYTGTLTGGTGVINIGSGQIYKDASGNVGIGASSPSAKLDVVVNTAVTTYAQTWNVFNGATFQFTNTLGGDATNGVYFGPFQNMPLRFITNNTERLRIDSSGNVGIGMSSPASKLDVSGGTTVRGPLDVNVASGTNIILNSTASGYTPIQINNGTTQIAMTANGADGELRVITNNPLVFMTNNTERARIDSSGALLVGTTSDWTGGFAKSTFVSSNASGRTASAYNTASSGSSFLARVDNTGCRYIDFFFGSATNTGSITTNGTTTSYNTTSDYRLKENVAPMTGALEKVQALNPVTYTWKADGSAGQGFIAHELQAVVPDAVSGEKDAVDEDGNPQYQGVDTSFLVATLTKAIQELNAKVEALEAQLNSGA